MGSRRDVPPAPTVRVTLTESLPQHFDIARAWTDHPQQRADGRGLARAVESEKAIDLAGTHAQVNGIDGKDIAKTFGQLIGFDRVGHAPSVPQIEIIYFMLM